MQQISVLPLGAGCEVGRSCVIVTINKKKIMLDCGLMIGRSGRQALPLFEKINAQDLSMILITHAHLDHCGALPYFLASRKYNKKVYMTQPTRDIYQYLLKDSLKVRLQDQSLFTSQDIQNSLRKITKVDFGVQIQDQGVKIIPYCAGHIVGAAMFLIEVDGLRVLYTGDYSCEQDRYIMKAEIPEVHVDVLIVESTYGTRKHQSRDLRQYTFTQQVKKIVMRKGKCLLPVFSAGRAQELLHILDEFWQQNKSDLGHIKIYYTCALIQKCKKVYEFYINMLSKKIQQKFYKQKGNNPFDFQYIRYLKSNAKLEKEENSDQGLVVMCTPGMLQSGQSRTLMEKWCHEPKNGLILTGYCVEGSIACGLKKGDKIKKLNSTQQIEVRMDVSEISFSAHADCKQTIEFIRQVQPSYVVLVHGSLRNATDLQKQLIKQFPSIDRICCPKNQYEQKFSITKTKKCQVAGDLKNRIQNHIQQAKNQMEIQSQQKKQKVLQTFKGVLVNTGDQVILIDQKEKEKFFPEIKQIKVKQKLIVPYGGGLTLALLLAQKIFGDCMLKCIKGDQVLTIKNVITMYILEARKTACLEFLSSEKTDIMADEFGFLLSNIPNDPEWDPISGDFEREKMDSIFEIIKGEYPQSQIFDKQIQVKFKENTIAKINLSNYSVDSEDLSVKLRFQSILQAAKSN